MKFNCGPTWNDEKKQKEEWHLWFAWYPIKIKSHDCRWLENIYRKGTFIQSANLGYYRWIWEYESREQFEED